MLEVHLVVGREVDAIDDVRRKFESSYTQNYFDPLNGDWISDDYYRIIDLTTKPGHLTEDEAGKLTRSITRLNDKHGYIEKRLGGSSLLGAYSDVAEQINAINSVDPSRSDIPQFTVA